MKSIYISNFTEDHMTTDKMERIRTWMHYTEPLHRQRGVTVFGEGESEDNPILGIFYNYDDRFESEKWRSCLTLAHEEIGQKDCARYFEIALSHYHGYPVDLHHIILGCNLSNGFSWMCFGYVEQHAKLEKGTLCPQA